MHAPTALPLLRQLVRGLGYAWFQLLLLVLTGLHLTKAFRSPFRANELPRPAFRPRFWPHPTAG